MVKENWQILSARVRGSMHIRQKMPCQDAILYHQFFKNSIVCAVADGHGSSQCPYSEDGARLAVTTAVSLIEEMVFYNSPDKLKTLIRQIGEVTLPQKIEKEWKNQVLYFHRQHPKRQTPDESQHKIYRYYGTTLMLLVIAPDFIYGAQIGDGDMLCTDEKGQVQYVIEQVKTYGVETHSLCEEGAWKNFKTAYYPVTAEFKGKLFLMSTDGYANSFVTSQDFLKTGTDYLSMLEHEDLQTIEKMLPVWLGQASREGSGDDMTLALIYREGK